MPAVTVDDLTTLDRLPERRDSATSRARSGR